MQMRDVGPQVASNAHHRQTQRCRRHVQHACALDHGKPGVRLLAVSVAIQTGNQHGDLMSACRERFAQIAQVVLNSAEYGKVVFIYLKDVHLPQGSLLGFPIYSSSECPGASSMRPFARRGNSRFRIFVLTRSNAGPNLSGQ